MVNSIVVLKGPSMRFFINPKAVRTELKNGFFSLLKVRLEKHCGEEFYKAILPRRFFSAMPFDRKN